MPGITYSNQGANIVEDRGNQCSARPETIDSMKVVTREGFICVLRPLYMDE